LIGVVAVIAVLAAAVLLATVRHIDILGGQQEGATLGSFANAFQQSVLTSRRIPDQTTWYSAIATNMGMSTNDVLYDARQQLRVFLIDPVSRYGQAARLPCLMSKPILSRAQPALRCCR
jgi:hypothetical protein